MIIITAKRVPSLDSEIITHHGKYRINEIKKFVVEHELEQDEIDVAQDIDVVRCWMFTADGTNYEIIDVEVK